MKKETIGELEELVLLTVGVLMKDAYAVTILDELTEQAGRKIDITAIHSVLRRLEKKGFVVSEMRGATAERGGRRKRYFTLTPAGRAVLDDSMAVRTALYHRLPKLTFSTI
ncbi:PadR family transcriptional regulator [Marinoscillum furvescens]|uniref:PadR family transcriptional regulator n=1 Tax=Marinoscillum furvescens DSM 4134 TaxID=1122208 RepID=A0A3D9L8G1_MARFU|nr:helix-turn-helix transcriptional regulator [Marinoscillum furvescens]REE01775.1 PadR family transcriptional regulator [Marinoscillum furvescens DSM 4134]